MKKHRGRLVACCRCITVALLIGVCTGGLGCRHDGGTVHKQSNIPHGHETAVSRGWPTDGSGARLHWPPSHGAVVSRSWPDNHDQTVSRTWWSGHTLEDSRRQVWPPLHAWAVSEGWDHSVLTSSGVWPPNHGAAVSHGWGPGHAIGVSVAYPPGHDEAASGTWTGHQPLWPAGHSSAASRSWSYPIDHSRSKSAKDEVLPPRPWPVFPEGHRWLESYKAPMPAGSMRDPWGGP